MGRPRSKRVTTLTRVYAEDVIDFKREMPGVPSADIIRIAWKQYNVVQKMGRFVYGKKVWKTHKK